MNKRHVFFWKTLRPLTTLFAKVKFGYTYEEMSENYVPSLLYNIKYLKKIDIDGYRDLIKKLGIRK